MLVYWGKALGLTACNELILEADVECGVCVGCECHSCFSDNVFRPPIFIACSVFDLAKSASATTGDQGGAGGD